MQTPRNRIVHISVYLSCAIALGLFAWCGIHVVRERARLHQMTTHVNAAEQQLARIREHSAELDRLRASLEKPPKAEPRKS